MLEARRQRESLAEVLERLVSREAGADRRYLEEDAARLAEVDRAEVVAVDDRRRRAAALDHPLAPALVLLGRRRPGDVVHGSRAADPGLSGLLVFVEGSATLAPRLEIALSPRLEAEGQLEAQAFGVGEGKAAVVARDGDALRPQALLPEVERVLGADAPDDAVHHARAGATTPCARVLEEGDVRARRAPLVGVEEVVDGRIVLVDRLLHEPQPEQPGVEVDVARRVGRDRCDVVDSFVAHSGSV